MEGRHENRITAKVSKVWGEYCVNLSFDDPIPRDALCVFVRPSPVFSAGACGGRWFEPDAVFGPLKPQAVVGSDTEGGSPD
jgi:hypothetical protein